MRRILIKTLLLLPGLYAAAQQFPVQVTPQLLPPYTLQVSEYYSPGTAGAKMNLMLLLRDFNKPTLQVRLRMSIEGQSVSVRSREDAVFTSITIESGMPKYVEPSELEQYFNSNNLEFSGMTRQQYELTGKLPEGFYTFCFEVIEAGTNLVVSNKGCAMAWMTLSEPPLLNIPRKAEALIPTTPQNILFQWTPRHTASPNAYNTEYVLSIVELLDDAIAPEAAFLSNSPLYVDSTNLTTYLYDVTKPALIAGKKYAWRVQVKAKNGLQDLAMFRNGGYSETFWFTYQNNCAVPVGIGANPQGQVVGISWTHNIDHLDYKVEYREKNNPNAVWFELGNTIPRVNISDLKYSTIYEYRVGGACEYGKFIFAPLQQFTTNDSLSSTVANCGVDPNLTGTNAPSIQLLNAGDTIKAGDFDVIATKVTGSQPSFSGEGYVAVSWLANMKLAVRFANITVGTDKKLKTGIIETTYDPTEDGIASIDGFFEGGDEYGNVKSGLDTADHKVDFVIGSPDDIDVVTGGGYNPETGVGPVTITITGSNNESEVITVNQLPVTIKDADGNIYQANKDGTVTSIGKAGGEALINHADLREVDTAAGRVIFMDYPEKQVYAFDEYNPLYEKSSAFKNKYQLLKGNYYVPAKASVAGKTDYLKAKIVLNNPSLVPDSVKFVSGKGIIYQPVKLSDDEFEIPVVGAVAGDAVEIFAVYKQPGNKTLNLGKILVASYPQKQIAVKIVPVNGAQIDINDLKAKFNEAYNPINVFVDVTADVDYPYLGWDFDGNGKMKLDSGGFFRKYSPEMRDLQTRYRKDRGVEANKYYLFVVSAADSSGVTGDMPRGNKYGYIFLNGNIDVGRTAAHEIGHGAFLLQHTFEEYDFEKEELPLNLMDYGSGTGLTKFQWDILHDPPFFAFSFDSDDDALEIAGSDPTWGAITVDGCRTYLTPSGVPFTLPENSKLMMPIGGYGAIPNGPIYAFELPDGKQYVANLDWWGLGTWKTDSTTFKGYNECTIVQGFANIQYDKWYTAYVYPTPVNNKVDVVIIRHTKTSTNCSFSKFKYPFDITGQFLQVDQPRQVADYISDIEPLVGAQVHTYAICHNGSKPTNPGTKLDEYFKKNGKNLQVFYQKSLDHNIKVYLYDCATNKVKYTIDKKNAVAVPAANQSKLYDQFEDGTFEEDYAIRGCIGEDGRWKYKFKFKKIDPATAHDLIRPKLDEVVKAIEEEVDAEIKEHNLANPDATTPEVKELPEDGSYRFKKDRMNIFKAGGFLLDVGKEVINEGRMPERIWDSGKRTDDTDPETKEKYKNTPVHLPPVLGGGTNQVIEEVTEVVQLLKVGYEFVRKPGETFKGIWNGIKTLTPAKVRKIIKEQAGVEEYEKGGDRALHQGGKHGVKIAMIVVTGIKTLTKGKEIVENATEVDNLSRIVDDFSDLEKKGFDGLDKDLSDQVMKSANAKEFAEEAVQQGVTEASDLAFTKGRKLTWEELKARFKRGNDFNKKGRDNNWYTHHEVVVEHPTLKYADGSPRRFRLDSYNTNDVIVSRKATDLSQIQKSTFEGYIQELKTKYPVGSKIVNQDRPGIGQTLQGQLVLEIPASNQSFSRIQEYIKLAEDNGVTISFKAE
jgi:TANFOR domain-containing protein